MSLKQNSKLKYSICELGIEHRPNVRTAPDTPDFYFSPFRTRNVMPLPSTNSADSDREDAPTNPPPDPFADLPPPPDSTPAPDAGRDTETAPSQPRSGTGTAQRRPPPAEGSLDGDEHVGRAGQPSSTGLLAALRWTARFFHVARPDLRRVIGGTVLIALVSLGASLYVWPVFGLFWLVYLPAIVLLTGVTIIAAYDALVGQQRSDLVRLTWAVRRLPSVMLAWTLWSIVVWLGTVAFILPGIYLFLKGLLIGPAAVLEDGLALRPFIRSKVTTHSNNLTVAGLFLVTFGGMWLLAVTAGSLVPATPVVMAGERLPAQDIKTVVGVTAGVGLFPLLAPTYTWVYVQNRPESFVWFGREIP